MPIQFTCPHCGLVTDVAEQYLGRSGPCAQCGKTVTIPAGGHQRCPQCGGALAPGSAVCPTCHWRSTAASGPHDLGEDPLVRMLLPVGRSGLAIAAGYAGLFAVLCFPAPIALVLGILAIRDLRKHPEKHGMGRAVFGLVSGIIFTLVMLTALVAGILRA